MIFRASGILFLLFQLLTLTAQNFYVPWNIEEAYKSGTRDKLGVPGFDYFQNSSHYSIKADFDPVKGILRGQENITYRNNSPDSLYYLVLRLYHDVLRTGNLRDEEINPKFLTKGVEIESLQINGVEYINNDKVYLDRSGTNLIAGLNEYLMPNTNLSISLKWITQLPIGHLHRFGNYGTSDWFVAYWYPQIAVYDDIDGWDMLNYTGQYEFYNDFNSYEVEVSLPRNHLMWATGTWQNAESVLSAGVFEKYKKAQNSDKQIRIVGTDDWKAKSVFRNPSKNVYKYTADNISDFAFSVSDNYLWDAASVITDSVMLKRTVVHAAYSPEAIDFSDLAAAGARAIHHFTYFTLGVEYPFPNVTIFNGDGGMEFPMMVNQRDENKAENYFIAMHELFHAYFPFLTGCNEKKYAWLDEGLTTYLPVETEKYIGGGLTRQLADINSYYIDFAGSDFEVPLMTPSAAIRNYSYYHQAYNRSAVAFSMLETYLGNKLFRDAIKEFIIRWSGKHPTGYDFLYTLCNYTGKDLDWIINPWFFEQGWVDMGVAGVKITNTGIDVEIENIGGFPVPVSVKLIKTNGDIVENLLPIDAWMNGDKRIVVHFKKQDNYRYVDISNPHFPDKTAENNYYYP